MKPYLDILKLVWPLALGMVNNAVMQFVDRIYLAHESIESLEAALPAGNSPPMMVGAQVITPSRAKPVAMQPR